MMLGCKGFNQVIQWIKAGHIDQFSFTGQNGCFPQFLDYRTKGSMTDMIEPCKNEVKMEMFALQLVDFLSLVLHWLKSQFYCFLRLMHIFFFFKYTRFFLAFLLYILSSNNSSCINFNFLPGSHLLNFYFFSKSYLD